MEIALIVIAYLLLFSGLIFQVVWRPRGGKDLAALQEIKNEQLRQREALRAEFTQSRTEMASQNRDARSEVREMLQASGDTLISQLTQLQKSQDEWRLNTAEFLANANTESRDVLERNVHAFQTEMATRLEALKNESFTSMARTRTEVNESLKNFGELMLKTIEAASAGQQERLKTFSENLEKLSTSNEEKLEKVRSTVEAKLSELREDNGKRLEEMRLTVDEKLQGTLEKRLGESFKQVSERLEQVHRGLGEMQNLAVGVGDLKKVLTNVKTRGGWGEVQLGALLEQMLTPGQFERNVATNRDSQEKVEYAIKLPGRGEDANSPIWLPVDSKFPIEDYHRLIEATEKGDLVAMETFSKALRQRVIQNAKDISLKYVHPPDTTDFAILFLPTEGLFAEVIRQAGVVEELQSKYRVVVAGPTTFAALLNSLQMGFRTLSIQKQSSEVWQVLGQVKLEFTKFGDSIDAVKKKLQEASNKMDDVGTRSRAVERRLKEVEQLPDPSKSGGLLDLVSEAEKELIEEVPNGELKS